MTGEKSMEQKEARLPATKKASRGSLLGTLLLLSMILIIIGVLALLTWGGYRGFRLNQEQAVLPSIDNLSLQEEKTEMRESAQEEQTKTTPEEKVPSQDEQIVAKARGTNVKVLNGGATKGSATTVADILKKDGFTKVATGNTLKDYVSVVIYYASGLEKEAEVVKVSLVKGYPKAEVRAALVNNTETTQAPLIVIVGK